jgi:hypothetical protein
MTTPNDRSKGKFVRIGKPLATTSIDCSHWQRSAGPRSRSHFIGVAKRHPPVEGQFARTPSIWLELVVSFGEGTPPFSVIAHANRLIAAATQAAPELNLIYDFSHTRSDNGDVIISLAPRTAWGTPERLAAAAEAIRRATSAIQHGIQVRVAGDAA